MIWQARGAKHSLTTKSPRCNPENRSRGCLESWRWGVRFTGAVILHIRGHNCPISQAPNWCSRHRKIFPRTLGATVFALW